MVVNLTARRRAAARRARKKKTAERVARRIRKRGGKAVASEGRVFVVKEATETTAQRRERMQPQQQRVQRTDPVLQQSPAEGGRARLERLRQPPQQVTQLLTPRPRQEPTSERPTPTPQRRAEPTQRTDETGVTVRDVPAERRPITDDLFETKETTDKPTVRSFLFGGLGERFVGIGKRPGLDPRPIITFRDVKETARKGGLPGKVVGEFIPTTPGQFAIIGGAVALMPTLPAAVRVGAEVGFTVIGTKQALTPGLAPEKRIAGGIVATLAGGAAVVEATPFIRGAVARASPKFKPVKTQPKGFKAVERVPRVPQQKIGLIPSGKTKRIPGLEKSPLSRGAFAFKRKGQFAGRSQTTVTTFQTPFKGGKLQRPFFTTPQDPVSGLPIGRVSRLGLVKVTKITPPSQVRIGFQVPRPEILVFKGATVTKIARPGAFALGRTAELEAIAGVGQVVTKGSQIGVTTIRGQAVRIFAARLGGASTTIAKIPTTTATTAVVPATSPAVSAATTAIITPLSLEARQESFASLTSQKTSQQMTTSTTTPTTPSITSAITPPIPTQELIITQPTFSPTRRTAPTIPTVPTTIPTFPTVPISPPPTLPAIPSAPPTLPTPTFAPTIVESFSKLRTRPAKEPRPITGRFQVELRRFGQFRLIGAGRTPREAVRIGRRAAETTLGATFRIKGIAPRRVRGFRTKPTKRGTEFIEFPRLRLGTAGEIGEIQAFRQGKRRKKKKKNGRK